MKAIQRFASSLKINLQSKTSKKMFDGFWEKAIIFFVRRYLLLEFVHQKVKTESGIDY